MPPSSIPLLSRRMRAFSGMPRDFQAGRQATKLWTEACQPEFESAPSCGEAKRTPIRPAALRGSRISETRETTKGSAELKFRIQFSQGGVCKLSVPQRRVLGEGGSRHPRGRHRRGGGRLRGTCRSTARAARLCPRRPGRRPSIPSVARIAEPRARAASASNPHLATSGGCRSFPAEIPGSGPTYKGVPVRLPRRASGAASPIRRAVSHRLQSADSGPSKRSGAASRFDPLTAHTEVFLAGGANPEDCRG